jgi:hypothetical protein
LPCKGISALKLQPHLSDFSHFFLGSIVAVKNAFYFSARKMHTLPGGREAGNNEQTLGKPKTMKWLGSGLFVCL